MEDGQAFMERLIRERAVAPASPGLPRLSNQERRSWWQFCLGMHDFIQALIHERLVDRNQASQLAQMQWLMLAGTYVFATSNPTLRDEQHRYIQICVNVAVSFAVIVDEPIELQDMCTNQYALGPSKIPAISEALLENQLRGWRDWRDAASPVGWVKDRTESIHKDHTLGGAIKKSDALYKAFLNVPARPPAEAPPKREIEMLSPWRKSPKSPERSTKHWRDGGRQWR